MITRTTFILIVIFALGGCGLLDTSVYVSRTHTLAPSGEGQTISVVPAENMPFDPLFMTNAARLGDHLAQHGYRVVAAPFPADLVAVADWRNDECTSTNRSVPIYTPRYNGKKWVQVQTGSRIEVDRRCTYSLDLRISPPDRSVVLYHGTARATVGFDDMESVLPTLIDGLFTDFPGASGTSTRERVSP